MITADAVSGLARTVLATKYDKYKPTPDFHEDLWALYCSPYRKCAAAAPRGHAKTTGGTGAYLITAMCMRERRYAMIISGTEEQSVEFINEIKGQFIDNEPLRRMFQIDRLQKDTSTDIIVRFKDGARFRILGKGAGQNPRGRIWMGTRPDIIIGDDLETEEQTDSDIRRAKFKRWFYGAVLPAGSDECIYRIHGTILHFDSLLENLMPDENKALETDDLRIFGKSKNNGEWLSVKYKAHNQDFSRI